MIIITLIIVHPNLVVQASKINSRDVLEGCIICSFKAYGAWWFFVKKDLLQKESRIVMKGINSKFKTARYYSSIYLSTNVEIPSLCPN